MFPVLTTILKASRQKHRSWRLYSNENNGLQQFQMESCQPIKRLEDKKKKNVSCTERPDQWNKQDWRMTGWLKVLDKKED